MKAFRPSPGFIASGGRYRRRGQNMDEVAFGRGGRDSATGSTKMKCLTFSKAASGEMTDAWSKG
ncbi:hypothetical protein IHE45_17G051100 [Dioscorea alata]|uniref:Uncharacterized protein n=1 Tax=Dioscorea alata TaxID=55571 RepID=A0ACB7UCD6_DIOAL|nr:hypothetical protein IHE45_17G051100 [Dioscorea alata]